MRKKQISKRMLAIILSAAMVASLLAGCGAKTEEVSEETVEQTDEDLLESTITEHMGIHTETESGNVTKDETVYVIADANGNTNEVIVSDWIKNAQAEGGLTDVSGLNDIENTSGNEIFTEDAEGTLHWTANGNDIHYQGTSDKDLPVEVSVKYYLEGVEMSPEEIAGKNGNVTIRFDYDNKERTTINVGGKEEEIYVPFAMISGVVLDTSKFSSIKVTNGRVISEGSKNIVVGLAFPGLEESLDVKGIKSATENMEKNLDEDAELSDDFKDFEIPDYVEISAYTVNFEIGQTMTVAATDVLSALDTTSDKISTDNVKDSLNDLSDGMNQLSDGSVELSAGAQALSDGAKTLSEKSVELNNGAKELDDGVKELADGAGDLSDGAKQLDDGTEALMNGTVALFDGSKQLVEGVNTLKDGTGTLKAGTSQLRAGYEGENGAVAGAQKLADGLAQLDAAVQSSSTGLSDESKAELIEKGSQGVKDHAAELVGGICKVLAGEISKNDVGAAAKSGVDSKLDSDLANVYRALVAGFVQEGMSEEAAKATAKSALEGIAASAAESTRDTIAATMTNETAIASAASNEQLLAALGELGGGLAISVAEGIMSSVAGSMATMASATSQLSDGSQKLVAGLLQLYTGTVQVDEGVGQLDTGVGSLQTGAWDLNNGVCSLKNGAIELKNGTSSLYDGTVTLKDGTATLKDGTSQLADGTSQFVDGTSQLYDGTKTLSDGTIELMDGVMKFDEEGISKLTNVFGSDVDDAVDRIKAVMDAGNAYKIYSDVAEGVDSSVKFVYKTDGVKVSE